MISAASRDVAYITLKQNGIRPIRVDVAPGLLNRFLIFGNRWVFASILAVLLVWITLRYMWHTSSAENPGLKGRCVEERAQLYGDPAAISQLSRDGWTKTFPDPGEAWMARHVIPGSKCDCEARAAELPYIAAALSNGLELKHIDDSDLDEIVKMNRMINGMRVELREYLASGGTVEAYMRRCDIRLRAEIAILERAKRDLRHVEDMDLWVTRNSELRAMGLPMVQIDPMNSEED